MTMKPVPLAVGEIKAARSDLAKWQRPEDSRQAVQPLLKRCRSADDFNRPNLKFLHDAYVLAEFVRHKLHQGPAFVLRMPVDT